MNGPTNDPWINTLAQAMDNMSRFIMEAVHHGVQMMLEIAGEVGKSATGGLRLLGGKMDDAMRGLSFSGFNLPMPGTNSLGKGETAASSPSPAMEPSAALDTVRSIVPQAVTSEMTSGMSAAMEMVKNTGAMSSLQSMKYNFNPTTLSAPGGLAPMAPNFAAVNPFKALAGIVRAA